MNQCGTYMSTERDTSPEQVFEKSCLFFFRVFPWNIVILVVRDIQYLFFFKNLLFHREKNAKNTKKISSRDTSSTFISCFQVYFSKTIHCIFFLFEKPNPYKTLCIPEHFLKAPNFLSLKCIVHTNTGAPIRHRQYLLLVFRFWPVLVLVLKIPISQVLVLALTN